MKKHVENRKAAIRSVNSQNAFKRLSSFLHLSLSVGGGLHVRRASCFVLASVSANNGGPSWVASIVNAIGNSQYWANTVIIVTWDDWGGWYDHVPPYKVVNDGVSWGSGYVYGFRVPLIVISPFARPRYISHVNHDFGSILHLVEENFNLPSLGYADTYADDLSDCFDFHQQPLVFQTIDAPLKADHFLHDASPLTDPDDD